jgi:alkylation response protein AidB-like acyl-CoA dehydrogenase
MPEMNSESDFIDAPDDPKLNSLCDRLRELQKESHPNGAGGSGLAKGKTASLASWPAAQLELLGKAGVYRWFIPRSLGGSEWSSADLVAGYIELSSACLTTAFTLTQRVAAIRRICNSKHEALRDRLLPGLLTGTASATVGISHLTTSRQHVRKPVLRATKTESGFLINGFSPWVTGACGAANLVMGAELDDGRQVLFAIPTDAPGVTVKPGFQLVGLTGSQTGAVQCENVSVESELVLAGPIDNVLSGGKTPTTGSFQTSALAIGLTQSAIEFIRRETDQRPDLLSNLNALDQQLEEIKASLFQLASGVPVCSNEELRTDANSLVLRATQSALVAAKGTGYVEGHPVGRWCQEALFFLVWSCPQSVLNANLCEFAGIESA